MKQFDPSKDATRGTKNVFIGKRGHFTFHEIGKRLKEKNGHVVKLMSLKKKCSLSAGYCIESINGLFCLSHPD